MSHRTTRAAARITLVALVVALIMALGVSHAAAAPAEDTATLVELRAALADAGGELNGYFKTVLKGDTITEIPCTVVGVTGAPGDVIDPANELILFESYGPDIDKIGGIASGMSGSPLFVDIAGTDYLVGAVAYGDWFSLNGFGAATAIEAMEDVEALGMPVVKRLDKSIATATGMKDRVVVESNVLNSFTASKAGMIALRPLSSLYIGGVSPESAGYRAYAKRAEARGFNVMPLAAQLGTGNESFETTLQGGATGVVLAARGDLWVGALGTVTYENAGRVMMFGHWFAGEGDTGMYLHNGWVDGVWQSSIFPWKLGVPGKLRGTVTQDRRAGVLGVVDEGPAEVIVRARAHRTDTSKTATSTVGLPDVVANSNSWNWYGITPFAATIAANKLFTTWPAKGSATTSTRVVVSYDGTDYVITRENVFDDGWDIPWLIAGDVDYITSEMLSLIDAGYHPGLRIADVSTEATISTQRSSATIVNIEAPNGLKVGDNQVKVSLLARGELATQTIETTLTIPVGTKLQGELTASAYGYSGEYFDEEMMFEDDVFTDEDRRTLDEVIDSINDTPANNELTVSYRPSGSSKAAAEVAESTPWYLRGEASKSALLIDTYVYPTTVKAGNFALIEGYIEGAMGGEVEIYALTAGEMTETLVATATITSMDEEASEDEEAEPGSFMAMVGPLFKNTTLRITYSGDKYSVPAETTVSVPVATRVSLSASKTRLTRGSSVTLTAKVAPMDFGGSVRFQRYTAYGWKTIKTVAAPTGVAKYKFTPPRGTFKWRAQTIKSTTNVTGTSSSVKLVVR